MTRFPPDPFYPSLPYPSSFSLLILTYKISLILRWGPSGGSCVRRLGSFPVCVTAESPLNISSSPSKVVSKVLASYKKLFFFGNCPIFCQTMQMPRGGPQNIFLFNILIYLFLKSPYKFPEPYDKPFWDIFEVIPGLGKN